VYSGVIEKDHLTISFVLKDKYMYTNLLAMCIIIISLISDEISKLVSKETFVEASNVVDKPSKIIIDICLCTNLYTYMLRLFSSTSIEDIIGSIPDASGPLSTCVISLEMGTSYSYIVRKSYTLCSVILLCLA